MKLSERTELDARFIISLSYCGYTQIDKRKENSPDLYKPWRIPFHFSVCFDNLQSIYESVGIDPAMC